MIPLNLATETITRLRAPATTDAYGNPDRDWSEPERVEIKQCSIQPVSTSEYAVDRDATVSRWRLFMQPDADLVSTDRVEAYGVTYLIDGAVQTWRDPASGALTHQVCLLIEYKG